MAAPQLKNSPVVSGSDGNAPAAKEDVQIFSLKAERTDLGKTDTLRFKILSQVLNEEYDSAIQELRSFLEEPSPYPEFKARITRYANHSVDLIYAIKAKRNFPGINSLTRAKQQELREKFKEHFQELQYILVRVEKVETDMRINDVRSTIYVVRALWVAAVSIAALAFGLELFRGLGQTGSAVFDESINQFTQWIFSLLKM